AFALASSSNSDKCSWHIVYKYARFVDYRDLRGFVKKVADRVGKPYSKFIDLGLYKSRFSLQLLGSVKEDRVKRPAVSSVKQGYCKLKDYLVQPKSDYSEIWPQTFSSEKLEKDEFQPIEDETALSKGAGLVTAKYEWLEIGHIRKGFVNFQAKSYEACPICGIKHERDQLLPKEASLPVKHEFTIAVLVIFGLVLGLAFGKVTKISAKPKRGIVKRIGDAILNPRPLVKLSEMMINVEKLKDAPEVYPDFLDKVHDISSLPCYIWVSYRKSLSNESKSKLNELKASGFRICNYQNMQGDLSINEWDIIIVQVESLFRVEFTARPFVAILDEANTIMRQMSSGTNARESENAMRDVLRSAKHVLAIDAFANISTLTFLQIYRSENIRVVDNKYQSRIGETVEFIYDPNSGAEAMRIGYDLLRQGKRVAFSPCILWGYGWETATKDFSDINVTWSELDCIAYTNTVEAGISFEVTGHFDIVIAITNIATPVHAEALAQMLYRIRDCPRRIVSIFYQKNSNELFRPPGRENIRAELASARPNNLPTAIKGHREWNNNTISYKVDESPA
ncbi:hypothetical protein RhiirA4_480746, partial [Rhizophagus irregularis]